MKKVFMTLALLGGLCTYAVAETVSDTLVIENVDRVKIETRDTVQRIVISGAKDDPDFHYVQRIAIPDSSAVRRTIKSVRDFNKITIKKNGKESKFSSSLHVNLGLNTMLSAPDGYDFKMWPSFDFGVSLMLDWTPYGKMNVWSIGFGLDWRKYRMSNDTYWMKTVNDVMQLTPYGTSVSNTKTRLSVFSLQVPLLYTHTFDRNEDWKLTLGGILNFNTGAHAERHYKSQGEVYDIATQAIGQRPVTIDILVALDTPVLPVYCKYCPMKFFKDDRGPKMNQLSIGFWF